MKHLVVDPANPSVEKIDYAVEILRKGGIIIYPTDTLYGLGVDARNVRAVENLYRLKGRNYTMPVSLMVSSLDQLEEIAGLLPIDQHSYLKKLLPGRITAIIKNRRHGKLHNIHRALDTEKMGFRLPANNICLRLAQRLGRPVTTTSANRSRQENILNVQDLIKEFHKEVDLFLDAGTMKSNKGSTVIDFTKDPFLIMRQGEIGLVELRQQLPRARFELRKDKFLITFICSGNICRSAMARVIMQGIIKDSGLENVVAVDSAGTLNMPVQPAHIYAVQVVEKHGYDLHLHKSQVVNEQIMENSDLVIAMALNHFDFLNRFYPEAKKKIILLKQWGKSHKLANPSIADPIGHDYEFFEKTYQEIVGELKRILPHIRNEIKSFAQYHQIRLPEPIRK